MNDPSALRQALEQFESLLGDPNTTEPVWQAFFTHNPFVFSHGLPLKLSPADILPLGRPGRTEPDFLIYPNQTQRFGTHGVIEIKRHTMRVTTSGRRHPEASIGKIIQLTRDADMAVRQLEVYHQNFDTFAPQNQATIGLSTAHYLFLIMGSSQEIADLDPILRGQVDQALRGVKLLGFDELLERYRGEVPLKTYLLQVAPRTASVEELRQLLGQRLPYSKTLYRLIQSPSLAGIDTSLLDAPFRYVPPFDTRFRPAYVPAIYGAESPHIAQAETAYHVNKMNSLSRRRSEDIRYALVEFQFEGALADIPNTSPYQPFLAPEDYAPSVALGKAAVVDNRDAVRYTSVRALGHVLTVYNRQSIFNAKHLAELTYCSDTQSWRQ